MKIEMTLKDDELQGVYNLMKRYGFTTPEELFKFLVKIFDQHYVEFLWGENKYERPLGEIEK